MAAPGEAEKVTPDGSAPVNDNVGVGTAMAEMPIVLLRPTANAVLPVTVKAMEFGAATVSVKACVTDPAELVAVSVSGNVRPAISADAVPDSVAVPFAPAVKVMPVGKVPVRVIVELGKPVVVTPKENAVPVTAVADVALANCGAWATVMVTCCVWLRFPLVAVIVTG